MLDAGLDWRSRPRVPLLSWLFTCLETLPDSPLNRASMLYDIDKTDCFMWANLKTSKNDFGVVTKPSLGHGWKTMTIET